MLVAGAAVSMLGWIGSDTLGASRILFAFTCDGLLPALLGHAGQRSQTPDLAIPTHAGIAAALALSGSFTGLVIASTLNTAGLYFLSCVAAWALHRRDVHTLGQPASSAFLPGIALCGMIAMTLLICVVPRNEIIGLALVVAVSVTLYAVVRLLGKRRLAG